MSRFSSHALATLIASAIVVSAGAFLGCTTTTTDDTASPAGPPGLTITPLSCNAPAVMPGGETSMAVVPYQRDGVFYISVKANPINTALRPSGDCPGIAQCGHLVATTTWTFDPATVAAPVTTLAAATTLELPIPLPNLDGLTSATATIDVRIHDDYDVEFRDLSTNLVIKDDKSVTLVLQGANGERPPVCPVP